VAEIINWGKNEKILQPVDTYILGNEPMLWNSTHIDVHPEPTSYEELLKKTIRYATEIRKVNPDAKIAGPALWGWPAYFFSAKDQSAGFWVKPDRRAHGDKPFLAWFLEKLYAYEIQTGIKMLDILDIHFYPQAPNIGGPGNGGYTDPVTSQLRIRSTRSLWDPSYKDESWIDDRIELLPRMKSLIDKYYPGLTISIGEYNFGAEKDISGGIALAEALGQFTRFNGLESAYYWTYPPNKSPAFFAFSAYRNYDGKGGRFQDWSLKSSSAKGVSIFASQNGNGTKIVAVVVNIKPKIYNEATIEYKNCTKMADFKLYEYHKGQSGILPLSEDKYSAGNGYIKVMLSPYSITVIELTP
jgi:hypothetical protein